ncbi:MAG: DUF4435 domain-containing protein [Butyrivibrio sp.]|nr:DUF4435 domain-containing protein [Butyrivibrio sp.]
MDREFSVTQMRKEREISQAVYIEFASSRKFYRTHMFCFYVGEDGKYYNPRVKQKFEKCIEYSVKNKKEALNLLERITFSNLYDDACVMFFIDRDYDDSISNYKEELYETPCYSIENLYAQQECLSRILQAEFGLSETDDDFVKCMNDFELRTKEFNEQILEFNALVYLWRKKSINYSFDAINTSRMVEIKVNKVSKASYYNQTIKEIQDKLGVSDKEIEDAKKELLSKEDYSLNFRGKNQIDFFVEFIEDLKRLNDMDKYFSRKRNGVHINITVNRLSELSQYAITPLSLKEFLEKHKEKFLALKAS